MDISESESSQFFIENPTFFFGQSFKFEGLDTGTEKLFGNIVKSLGGSVTESSTLIICPRSYAIKNKDKKCYSSKYILESVRARKILNPEDYRYDVGEFVDNKQFCCVDAQYIFRTASCKKYNENNKCKKCLKLQLDDVKLENTNYEILNSRNFSTPEFETYFDDNNSVNHETEDLITEKNKSEDSMTEKNKVENIMTEKNKPHFSKHKKTKNDESPNLVQRLLHSSESSDNSDCESEKKIITKTTKNRQNLVLNPLSKAKKWIEKKKSVGSSEKEKSVDSSEKENESLDNYNESLDDKNDSKIDETNKSQDASNSESSLDINLSSSEASELHSSDDEDNYENIRVGWWSCLPEPGKFQNPLSRKELGRRRGKTITEEEKKIMIQYLVVHKSIHLACSRKIFVAMHMDGYLTHRTIESLNNNMRKSIIPNINYFNLPERVKRMFRKCT